MFIEFLKGGRRYDIAYPKDKLFIKLKKLADKEISKFEAGCTL